MVVRWERWKSRAASSLQQLLVAEVCNPVQMQAAKEGEIMYRTMQYNIVRQNIDSKIVL